MQGAPAASNFPALAATSVDWLVKEGLQGCDMAELVAGLARRFNAGGLEVDRAGCAVLTLHPQFVSQEVSWSLPDDRVATSFFTPDMMQVPANLQGPYFHLAVNGLRDMHVAPEDGSAADRFPLLVRLRSEGFTDYFAFYHPTGSAAAASPFARRLGLVPCVVGSFATRRAGGFRPAEIDCFRAVSGTLALAVKSRATNDMAAGLLGLYVGRASGSKVLSGQVTRGDYSRISCGIWLCDLRQSSRLVARLPLDEYIALLNRYFDVAAGAVMQAGGEVLKLIGDAVLGIFRSEDAGNDLDMRERALAATSSTLHHIKGVLALGYPLEVGIALHVGQVLYGNVGSEERLDFTVIGRAVNEAARLQELTKRLERPALASSSFANPIRERFVPAGPHPVPGFDEPLEVHILRL